MGRGTRLAARLISLGAFFSGLSGALAAPAPLTDMIGPNSEARIRVRIAEAAPMASVRGFDLRLASSHVDGASQWELRCQGDRVRAIQVGGAKTLELKSPVTIQTLAGFLNFRGRPYREELRIHAVGSLCEVINVVSLEKYLNGLVNAEFSSRWNEEAIA
ncbi:MAG: SpoIID/LytB domain-containing protein, partial [Oligoflexia bacterium]|nr:SpoIID/LytB domain-containing protein [Oligoflexia bacterium]